MQRWGHSPGELCEMAYAIPALGGHAEPGEAEAEGEDGAGECKMHSPGQQGTQRRISFLPGELGMHGSDGGGRGRSRRAGENPQKGRGEGTLPSQAGLSGHLVQEVSPLGEQKFGQEGPCRRHAPGSWVNSPAAQAEKYGLPDPPSQLSAQEEEKEEEGRGGREKEREKLVLERSFSREVGAIPLCAQGTEACTLHWLPGGRRVIGVPHPNLGLKGPPARCNSGGLEVLQSMGRGCPQDESRGDIRGGAEKQSRSCPCSP